MPCYHPLKGIRGGVNSNGKRPLLFCPKIVDSSSQIATLIPCGQCVGCRLERSRNWAMRCMDEAQISKDNSFITLTYSDDNLPEDGNLVKRDLQLFFKRLRKNLDKKVRYYACGEYGEKFGRPHFHACIFGYSFPDRKFLKVTGSGFNIYRSMELEKSWTVGYASVSDFSFETAAYVARYCMKKVTGKDSDEHYVNKDTGVIKNKEFTVMSRGGNVKSGNNRGIGYSWYDKFRSDMFPFGTKVVNGVECKTPRYYDGLYEKENPIGFAKLKAKRNSLINIMENTMMRLLVKEEVTLNKIAKLKREFEYVEG